VTVAARMRRYRARQAEGTAVAPVEVTVDRLEALAQAGFPPQGEAPADLARAIGELLDWLGRSDLDRYA
jgi:hypothetical protein